jgi:hypothetical protein
MGWLGSFTGWRIEDGSEIMAGSFRLLQKFE